MTKASDPYPEDEFDAPPAPDAPVGVHRAPRSWWSRWWPFVAVIVLVPSLTVGFVVWASSWDGDLPGFSSSADDDAAAPEESTPAPEDTGAAPEESAPVEEEAPPVEEEPPAVADLSTPVRVLNAANVSGLAGSAAGDLEDAGFTSVVADNGNAGGLTTTTVFYGSPELAVTAQQVATTLGITSVVESADTAPEGIVVLLVADFAR
ncbi:LytR C-terminal domain-containing protein [Cellulomonas triticagri]|uniref:LytR C-terminal domain-containing protein n=1 Tax=Cellulomonas triticagri TaxID=2483352 RepID=UPI001315364B|nr:LytR C-terminal domain-containing protein [Cellulomonas triticagri]